MIALDRAYVVVIVHHDAGGLREPLVAQVSRPVDTRELCAIAQMKTSHGVHGQLAAFFVDQIMSAESERHITGF